MGAVWNKFNLLRNSELIYSSSHCKSKVFNISVVVLYLEQILVNLGIKRLQVVELI